MIYFEDMVPGEHMTSPTVVVDRDEMIEQEANGTGLVRTVRQVVWRRVGDDGVQIIPLVRWEVLDYVPFEVLDFPDEER